MSRFASTLTDAPDEVYRLALENSICLCQQELQAQPQGFISAWFIEQDIGDNLVRSLARVDLNMQFSLSGPVRVVHVVHVVEQTRSAILSLFCTKGKTAATFLRFIERTLKLKGYGLLQTLAKLGVGTRLFANAGFGFWTPGMLEPVREPVSRERLEAAGLMVVNQAGDQADVIMSKILLLSRVNFSTSLNYDVQQNVQQRDERCKGRRVARPDPLSSGSGRVQCLDKL